MAKTWEQLQIMQPIASKMLMNSIRKQRLSHAYLLEGPKGTGKLETAIQLTKNVFCSHPNGIEPCQVCSSCRRIESGNYPNLYVVRPDGLSIKKQQIQELQEEFAKTGVESNRKVYIIEHADRMTVNAANTLLKFLEEPSHETTAILLTEQVQQMLNTILSRCQILTFTPLSKPMLIEQLQKQGVSSSLAYTAAQLTSNFEEALSFSNEEWFAQARALVIKLCEALGKEASSFFFVVEKWTKHFSDKEQLQLGLDLLLLIYKDVLYVQLGEEEKVVFQDQRALLASLSYSQKRIVSALSYILEAKNKLNANVSLPLVLEQLVFRLQEG